MNDAARKEDELSKQDTGRWKRYDVLLFYMWTMAHHPYKKREKILHYQQQSTKKQ
jgi:hypothetical protein